MKGLTMYTKEQAVSSIKHEVSIIKHLASKVTPDLLSYRPTAGQRSLLELLQYLSVAAVIPAQNITTGNWDHAMEISQKAAELELDGFAAAMDHQVAAIEDCLSAEDGDALGARECTMPWGTPCTGGEAFVNMVVKCLVAYRMQLFLYLRSCDVELSTANCWVGVDAADIPK